MIVVSANAPDLIPKRLGAFTRRLDDMTAIYAVLGTFIEEKVEECFATFTDPYGNPWVDVQPDTLRKRKVSPGGILTDTGDYRNSTVVSVDGLSGTISIGQDVTKSIHNWGNDDMNLPPRMSVPIDGIPLDWTPVITGVVVDALRSEFPWL